jgi:hypothetical protein
MIAPANLRPVRNTREAILLANDIANALVAERALDIHTRGGAELARADLRDLARQALEALNDAAPALGIGPKVVQFPGRRDEPKGAA